MNKETLVLVNENGEEHVISEQWLAAQGASIAQASGRDARRGRVTGKDDGTNKVLKQPRNEKCRCGSGRKYKNCCYRLRMVEL